MYNHFKHIRTCTNIYNKNIQKYSKIYNRVPKCINIIEKNAKPHLHSHSPPSPHFPHNHDSSACMQICATCRSPILLNPPRWHQGRRQPGGSGDKNLQTYTNIHKHTQIIQNYTGIYRNIQT